MWGWTRRLVHVHRCPCGSELRCTQPLDTCAVIDSPRLPYRCPTCDRAMIDAYISTLELEHRDEKH